MSFRLVLTIVTIATMASCSTQVAHNTSNDPVLDEQLDYSLTKQARRSFMVGRWYGKQPTQDGGVRQQINERNINGTYKIIFRYKDSKGEVTEEVEVGQWGVAGPIYFSIYVGWVEKGNFIPSNPEDPDNYNAYEIIELTNEDFKYKSYVTNSIYTLKKVGENFEFPDI